MIMLNQEQIKCLHKKLLDATGNSIILISTYQIRILLQ